MPSDVSGWLAGLSPWSVVLALVSVIGGWILARIARRGATALLGRLRGVSPSVVSLSARIVYYAVLLLAVGVALSLLGAPIQPLLAAAVVVAVVLVLTLRGISDNFAAGIVLQTRRPIDIGDLISSDGQVGTVLDMNARSVVLRTGAGHTAHLPNSTVLENTLINYSEAGANRSEVEVRVKPSDRERAELLAAAMTAAERAPGVIIEDRQVQTLTILDSPTRLIFRLQFWTDPEHATTVTAAVVSGVAAALRTAGTEAVVTSQLAAATPIPAVDL